MTHDFRKALDDWNEFFESGDETDWDEVFNLYAPHAKTIQAALRIADRLASGELVNTDNPYDGDSGHIGYINGWNGALRAAQMIKEESKE